ncbi:Gldg family protein [Haliangium sp.]|uniref:Gldg family protein n=1 Tax=Haliangium sp. TaxID=2663208 RepID=UPI003D102140
MRQVWSIASKELRGYFNSAVALIFLATFLSVVLFTFFWGEDFWATNAANVAPLFKWLPLLLIFLVAALTMRLWSEEHKTGTIEILLTLPVPIRRLVLGKFVAGLLLVAIALALTLGLPITVSIMGDLDWGPVIGGYVGALLLASAYLSIGLCISSATDNQIVALIGTALVGALFYVPGVEAVAGLFGVEISEILRLIGTGSRFESVARGVLDLRDLAYYAALVLLFLTLNTVLLEAKRWSASERTRAARTGSRLAVVLVALNALALNLWLQPVTAARVDLTEDNMYSLSEPTEKLLASLDEPLILRGYFSEETHPILVPLVPQIRNMLAEYAIAGGDMVDVQFLDPSKDEDIEAEAFENYGIKPTPLQFAGRHQQSIVNAYFHVLVAYGDQHVVLSMFDLIKIDAVDINNVKAYVDNLEYEITKSIRKVVYEFQSIDALFAGLPGKIELEAYVTPDKLPEQWAALPEELDAVAATFEQQAGGKFTYKRTSPATEEEQRALFDAYGLRPFTLSLLSNEVFYLHLVLKLGDRVELVRLPEAPSGATLQTAIRTSIERLAPGFTTVVGLVTPKPETPPPMPGAQQPPQPRSVQNFQGLARRLRETYQVRMVDLDAGSIPDEVDVLLVAGPERIPEAGSKAIDQFLMRGGPVVLLAGRYRIDLASPRGSIRLEEVDSGLDELLSAYGVEVAKSTVLDDDNDAFPMPRMRNVGGAQVPVVERIPYPFFVRVGRDAMDEDSIITRDLDSVVAHWASPVLVKDQGEAAPTREIYRLLRSSESAWLQAGTNAMPDASRPQPGTSAVPGGQPPYVLAVAIKGTFDSAYGKGDGGAAGADAADPSAVDEATDEANGEAGGEAAGGAGGEGGVQGEPERLLERSPPDARLVVVGSSNFVADTALGISEASGSSSGTNNLALVENSIDWAVADTDLLSIRSRGAAARTLGGVDADARTRWELINYLIALLGLGLVVVFARARRQARIRTASRIIVPTAQPSFGARGGGARKASDDDDEAETSDEEEQT